MADHKNVFVYDRWGRAADYVLFDRTNPISDHYFPSIVATTSMLDGLEILRAEAMFKYRSIYHNGNAGASTQAFQLKVKKSTGTWGVDDIACIYFPSQYIDIQGEEPWSHIYTPDFIIGDVDISSEVDDTTSEYHFRPNTNSISGTDDAFFNLQTVQTGIRYYLATTSDYDTNLTDIAKVVI